jgi:hypothetical protein
MAMTGVMGDPVCTMSAVGEPDPNLVPHGARIGIGNYGSFWCLIVSQ